MPNELPPHDPVLVLQHDPTGRPAYLRVLTEERGHAIHTHYVPSGAGWPDVSRYAYVIVMGSPEAAYDDDVPWLGSELRFLENAIDVDVPMIGVCFGGQLLARAMGGVVKPSTRPEVGWHAIETLDPGRVQGGTWFGWHLDTFEVPDTAELLAISEVSPQAFAAGPVLGLQFHPEVTREHIQLWLQEWAGKELANHSLTRKELLEQTEQHLQASHVNARHLFDRWYADHVAGRDA